MVILVVVDLNYSCTNFTDDLYIKCPQNKEPPNDLFNSFKFIFFKLLVQIISITSYVFQKNTSAKH